MFMLNAMTLISNGFTLALALSFLILILWHDSRKEQNQFFALFLISITLWNVGSLIVQVALLAEVNTALANLAISIMELGFTGSSVAGYLLITVLVGAQTRRFRALAFSSILLIVIYRALLIVTESTPFNVNIEDAVTYRFPPLVILFYLIFDGVGLYLTWYYRRKIQSRTLKVGIVLFFLGQSFSFINPELIIASFSTSISSLGALAISFAILQQEIITPLSERSTQLETMHRVSLAITSQLSLNTVLTEIATQAAGWINADGVGIFLEKDNTLELAAVYNLPLQLLNTRAEIGQGVAGTVAQTQRSIYLENYARDWSSTDDFPLARQTFGSVICVPLVYGSRIIGVLIVVAGKQRQLFSQEDVYLLELLGAQAAVAIAHSRLFSEQLALTDKLEQAHSQLETVLISTENPVIAVDRSFNLIFANPAARKLFKLPLNAEGHPIQALLPAIALPGDAQEALRVVRHKEGYVYEISLDNKFYLVHLAILGRPRIAGWVAVLNDITQLKELDRLKSEMVRMASHDLKNPLMGAMAYIDLLRDDLLKDQDQDVHRAIAVVERQHERMSRIIQGILDLERLKTTGAHSERCHPSDILNASIHELDYLISDGNVEIISEVAQDVTEFLGDCEQFGRALVNLLENAIKFSLNQGRIHVNVYADNGHIIFRIQDNGVGIPESLQLRIFDRFFRGQQKGVEHVTGSGLGLSLVKTIVENHKGRIWFESIEGVGTTFFVSVPTSK